MVEVIESALVKWTDNWVILPGNRHIGISDWGNFKKDLWFPEGGRRPSSRVGGDIHVRFLKLCMKIEKVNGPERGREEETEGWRRYFFQNYCLLNEQSDLPFQCVSVGLIACLFVHVFLWIFVFLNVFFPRFVHLFRGFTSSDLDACGFSNLLTRVFWATSAFLGSIGHIKFDPPQWRIQDFPRRGHQPSGEGAKIQF